MKKPQKYSRVINRISLFIALGILLFACKQKVESTEENNEILITVNGDEGFEVDSKNSFRVNKNSTWKDIENTAKNYITPKLDKELKEWRINNKNGQIISFSRVFNKDEIVFAVSKEKKKPIPPTQKIIITIEADEGYTFNEATKPCIIEAKEGDIWSSIKEKTKAKIKLKGEYEKTGWKLGGETGSIVEDTFIFNKNTVVYATSKKKGKPELPKITITVKGDEGVKISSPNNFTTDKGAKWADIRGQAEGKVIAKENFEIKEWHLDNATGTLLKDESNFEEAKTVFAVSKRKVAIYKVQHLQENIENDKYTLKETEDKTGEAGKNTIAEAKQYDGFSCQGLAQTTINADGSTVVQIKYKRNRVSLILDLAGGTTTTQLENGDSNTKLLKGKFGAKIEVNEPEKENYSFEKWEPDLPKTFPATSTKEVYVAKWTSSIITLTIEVDKGFYSNNNNTITVGRGIKWKNVKTRAEKKAEPRQYFETASWHLNNANGAEIKDETQFKEDSIVYAVSRRKQIIITILGDEGIEKNTVNTLRVNEGAEWKDVKSQVEALAQPKEYFEIIEWRLDNKDGSVIKEDKILNADITVFAVSKRQKTHITVKGDSNMWIKYPSNFYIDKGVKWKDIKPQAEEKVELKQHFEIASWHFNNASGAEITDETKFENNYVDIYAVSRKQQITITVLGDEGIEKNVNNTMKVGKGAKWEDIQEKVKALAQPKEYFEIIEWRLNTNAGSEITYYQTFEENTTVFAVSKRQQIYITISGDEGINVEYENYFYVDKGVKWKDIKTQAEEKAVAKENFEFVSWHFDNASGDKITEETEFIESKIVFAVSKRKTARYTVEHWQENIDDDKFTKIEDETKEGKAGLRTEVVANSYEGFEALPFSQETIYISGSTVVRIKYKRKIVSLIIDLDMGTTTTKLDEGENGEKLLKGKFGANVNIETPTLSDYMFAFLEWQPPLPAKFPASDNTEPHVAKWKTDVLCMIFIEGDERVDISNSTNLKVAVFQPKTFGDVRSEVEKRLKLKAEWSNSDYGVYKWLIKSSKEKIQDDTPLTHGILNIYAVTNYQRFKIDNSKTKLTGYNGNKPRGNIIIPKEIEIIQGFAFNGCTDIKSVNFSSCSKLTTIENSAFFRCDNIESLDFSNCGELTTISKNAFKALKKLRTVKLNACNKLTEFSFSECANLQTVELSGIEVLPEEAFFKCENIESLDFSKCPSLKRIDNGAFSYCTKLKELNLDGCNMITSIGSYAFNNCTSLLNIDFSAFANLETIEESTFNYCEKIESIDLSNCSKLKKIKKRAFEWCKNAVVKLPISIIQIDKEAFGTRYEQYCKKILVPNDKIKQLVIDSAASLYNEPINDRVEIYQ